MTSPLDTPVPATGSKDPQTEQGWYLYCITRSGLTPDSLPDREDEVWPEAGPLEVADCGSLAAVGRRVPLADFDPETIRARADDTGWLEAVALMHNEVIEAVHAQQAVLPAAFGSVYARREDVLDALHESKQTLIEELARLEGCDEWAVHLYASPDRIRRSLAQSYPAIQEIQNELAQASPGRAYFLKRRLEEEMSRTREAALTDVARDAYVRLLSRAREGEASSPRRAGSPGEVEILRAAFLVPRTSAPAFLEEVDALTDHVKGLRSEYSGPWPPYSFAAQPEEINA